MTNDEKQKMINRYNKSKERYEASVLQLYRNKFITPDEKDDILKRIGDHHKLKLNQLENYSQQ